MTMNFLRRQHFVTYRIKKKFTQSTGFTETTEFTIVMFNKIVTNRRKKKKKKKDIRKKKQIIQIKT